MPKYVPHGDICSIRAVRLPVSSRKVKQLRHFSYIFFCGGYSESEKQTNKQTQKTFKGRSWLERLKQIPAEKNLVWTRINVTRFPSQMEYFLPSQNAELHSHYIFPTKANAPMVAVWSNVPNAKHMKNNACVMAISAEAPLWEEDARAALQRRSNTSIPSTRHLFACFDIACIMLLTSKRPFQTLGENKQTNKKNPLMSSSDSTSNLVSITFAFVKKAHSQKVRKWFMVKTIEPQLSNFGYSAPLHPKKCK